MPDDELRNEIDELLRNWRTAAIATVDADGLPHACNCFYVSDDDLRLHWISGESSAHSVHIAATGRCAIAVYAHTDEESSHIRGVQMHGRVEPVRDKPLNREIEAAYKDKYPFVRGLKLAQLLLDKTFYRFTPTWARLIDNRKGFGWKAELELPVE